MTLPSDLLSAFETAKNRPDMENFQRLIQLLVPHIEEPAAIQSDEFKDELLRLSLETCLLAMTFSGDFHLNQVDIETTSKLLTNDAAIKNLVRNEDTARMLAFMCLSAVAYYNEGAKNIQHDRVIHVLEVWTGQSLLDEQLTVENITKHIYGPAVYALYRTDVVSDKDLPGLLCQENVAVVGLPDTPVKTPGSVGFDLPKDLASNGEP